MSGSRQQGFSFIEILVVLVIMGLLVSSVVISFSNKEPADDLEKEARKFRTIFHLAADYALLNNAELGLHVKDNQYQLLAYDGDKWGPIPGEDKLFASVEVDERFKVELELDDLPWPTDENLFSADLFNPEDEESLFIEQEDPEATEEQKKKYKFPQVFILSSGDITPFVLTFGFSDELLFDEVPVEFKVEGEFATPLKINRLDS